MDGELALVMVLLTLSPLTTIGGASISGGLITIDGITVEVPWIPPFPAIQPGASFQPLSLVPVPSFITEDCIGIPGVGKFCIPVPDPANIVAFIEDTIANAVISGYNAVGKSASLALDQVWNALIFAVDVPIYLFDGFTTSFGALVLGGVLSLGEPWSLFLVPVVWLVVSVVLVLLVAAMLWVLKQVVSALKEGAVLAG